MATEPNKGVTNMTEMTLLDPVKSALPLRRFTVAEYHRLTELGFLSEDDHVELIDGVLVHMAAQRSRHSSVISRMGRYFYSLDLQQQVTLRIQLPVHLSDASEPEPGLALVKPRDDMYVDAHPSPEDVLLLIEVSDTTLEVDQSVKLPRYAAAGIPEVWIINLVDDIIEVYRAPVQLPSGGALYQEQRNLIKGDRLSPEAWSAIQIAVDDVLGGGL